MNSVDVTLSILETLLEEKPDNIFIGSLHQQYCNRGGLSKKQLEGLLAKAQKSSSLSIAKIATLEAIIKKKPTRYKSEKITTIAYTQVNSELENALKNILEKYPQHKAALHLQSKTNNREILSKVEEDEIKRLSKLLLKQ
jgi:hypothetical protein